eukprot:1004441_1
MSPLWFAIKVIDDKTLIKTLLQRGCKLNIEEMNKLSHLYCDYAIKDNNKILATITQSKQPNDDEKEEEKANEPDINEQIHAIRKLRYEFIKYRIDATKKGNDIDEDDTFVFESNLTSIYRVIQRCNLPQSYVCDANQDNPLHLCIKSAIQQTKASDVNVIKILKLECPQWLYLRNADGKTPIDLCIDARHVRLFETLLFDTKDEKYLLDSKRQTQVEGMKKRIPIPDADIGALRLTLNASLYHKLVSRCNHIENFNVLLTWIIDVTDDLLSPYLKSVPPKLLDIQDLQTDATILDCGVESKLLKHYMQSDDPNKIDATNTILMLLQCILNSNDESGRSPLVSLCAEKYKLYVIDVLVHHFDLKLGEQDASIIECYTKQCESVRANENDAILRMLNKAFGVKTDADKTKEPDETESKEDAKEDMNGMSDDEADTDHEAKSKDEVDADETKANVMSDEEQQLSEALIADHNEESKLKVVSVVDALLMDELNEETNASSWVELIYSTFVESLSMADFITDFLVLKQLFEGGHQWWSSWMVLMMLSSYLVSFSVVGTLFVNAVSTFVQKRQLTKQSKCSCQYVLFVLMAMLLMTPLSVLYFFIVDVVFMIYILISALLYFLTCSYVDITDFIDDYVFQKVLGMNRMQVIGYRRLRTLSQLLFETVPQCLLQLHMLRVSNLDGLDTSSLMMSILFALLHMLFEGIIIYSDSKACDSSVLEYGLQCLHARMNWIPYTGVFETRLKQQIKAIEHHDAHADDDLSNKSKHYYQFNYENLIANVCGLNYKLEFKFSNDSMAILSENLISLPMPSISKDSSNVDNPMLRLILSFKNREDDMVHIVFGNDCCRNINLSSFCDAYRNGYKKVIFNTNNIDWKRMMKRENDVNSNINSNSQLLMLLNELVLFVELDAVNVVLSMQPSFQLDQRTRSIKCMILKLLDANSSDSLFILKQYSEKGVQFGYNCSEAQIIYDAIYHVLANNALNDRSYCYVVLFYLWYTQHTIYNHRCVNGCCSLIESLSRHDDHNVEELIDNLLHDDHYLPNYLEVHAFKLSFQLLEAFGIYWDALEQVLMEQCNKPLEGATQTQTHNQLDLSVTDFEILDITAIDIEFLETVVRCNPKHNKRGFPKHKEFEALFVRLDPIVITWKMHSSYYYLYLLASQPFRKLTKVTVDSSKMLNNKPIVVEADQSGLPITNRYAIPSDLMLNVASSDIMGIKDICVSFQKLNIQNISVLDHDQEKSAELCEFKVILNVPLLGSNSGDDIYWNEVELVPTRILGYTSGDTDATIRCNIAEHSGFGLFNPCAYDIRDLQVECVFVCPPNHKLTCANVNIEFTYFMNDFEIMDPDDVSGDAVLPMAITASNAPLIEFVLCHNDMFDLNAINKESGNNAMHAACERDYQSIPAFKKLISKLIASGVYLNVANHYGHHPVDLIGDFNKRALMVDVYHAVPTVKSGMGSSQSVFSRCNDGVIENIFSFLNIQSQVHLKNTCIPMRHIIQQSDMCARITLSPFVEQTKHVDFTDVKQLLPMYDAKCYNQMALYCNSSLFQTYCRLISYHWHLVWTRRGRSAGFTDTCPGKHGLTRFRTPESGYGCDTRINHDGSRFPPNTLMFGCRVCNYDLCNACWIVVCGLGYLYPHNNMEVFLRRDMNDDTKQLFTLNPKQKYTHTIDKNDSSALIWDKKTFLFLLNEKWHLNKWQDIVFTSGKHLLFAGSVCSALVKFIDKQWQMTKENQLQDLNFAMLRCSISDARTRVNKMKSLFDSRGFPACICDSGSKNTLNLVVNFTEKESNIIQMNKKNKIDAIAGKDIIAKEPFLTLFEFIAMGKHCGDWSFLHQIDLDCNQVAFDGQEVISTYAFLQSVTTQTIIDYSLVNDYQAMQRTNRIGRVDKYYHRGFTLLAPKVFDFRYLDSSLQLSIPKNDIVSELIMKRSNDIKIMCDTYKMSEQEKASEYNTFLSKTRSGMSNNDSMHMMDLFMKLQETNLVSKEEMAQNEATCVNTVMTVIDDNNYNAFTHFKITKKGTLQQPSTLQTHASLDRGKSVNQSDAIDLNELMMMPERKIFIAEHINGTASDINANINERLTIFQDSALYKVANEFAYRASYYHKMEGKVTEYLNNLNDDKLANKLHEIHSKAVKEELDLIEPLFDITTLARFLDSIVNQRNHLDSMFESYQQAHTDIFKKMANELKKHRISHSKSDDKLVNTFISDHEKLFSVQDLFLDEYRKWLIELCFKLLEGNIICCIHSDFDDKTGKYKYDITSESSQESAWKDIATTNEQSDENMGPGGSPTSNIEHADQKTAAEEAGEEEESTSTQAKHPRSKSYYSNEIEKGNTFWISKKDDCRTFIKVFYESAFDPQNITDILRASLVFDNFADLYNALITINQFCKLKNPNKSGILGFRNCFLSGMVSGRRQIIVNFHLSTEIPVLCELQLHFAPYWESKHAMHDKYKVYRMFDVRDSKNNRTNAVYEYLTDKQRLITNYSSILTKTETRTLLRLLQESGRGLKRRWKLLYRGSTDGFRASTFHDKCDGKAKTVSIIRTDTDNVFGGYASVPWAGAIKRYVMDKNAFIYLIRSCKNYPPQVFANQNVESKRHVYHGNGYMCTFGNDDIDIADNCNKNTSSSVNGNRTYMDIPSRFYLNGETSCFKVLDIEVFINE